MKQGNIICLYHLITLYITQLKYENRLNLKLTGYDG